MFYSPNKSWDYYVQTWVRSLDSRKNTKCIAKQLLRVWKTACFLLLFFLKISHNQSTGLSDTDWINLNIWTFGWAHIVDRMKPTLRTATKGSTVSQAVKIPENPVQFCFKFEGICPGSKLNYSSFPICFIYSCVGKCLSKFCVGSHLLWEAVGLISSVSLHMCGDTYCNAVGNRGTSSWTSNCKMTFSGPNK